jgi:hypothetical protein
LQNPGRGNHEEDLGLDHSKHGRWVACRLPAVVWALRGGCESAAALWRKHDK